jgi:hypothetical protein
LNPAPLTVRLKSGPPAIADTGLRVLIDGTALTMSIVIALVVPPPGAGVKTVTEAEPGVAISLAEIVAVTWVLLTKVVGRSEPFQRTLEALLNAVPLTVREKSGSPAVTDNGLALLIVGAGLTTWKFIALDAPPPGVGLKAVTETKPPPARSPVAIAAVNWLLLTKVVGRSEPFQRTLDVSLNPVPFTVKLKPGLPAGTDWGLMVMIFGVGLPTTSVVVSDVCAPPLQNVATKERVTF